MLTYIMNAISVNFGDKGNFEFPSIIELFVELGPHEFFGMKEGFTRAIFAGWEQASEITIDFERGTQGCRNILNPDCFKGSCKIEETASLYDSEVYEEYNLSLEGNILELRFNCENKTSFQGFLYLARYLIPATISLEFWEPVYVERVSGKCNGREFKVKLKTYVNLMEILRPGDTERRINTAFRHLKSLRSIQSARLKIALHYYHTARRLLQAGQTIWEFVPEIVLNYSKILEVLFGNSRDDMRKQLELLGYKDDKIDSDFVPITLLRNHFDIAHVRLSGPKNIATPEITKYICFMETKIGELLKMVLVKCQQGDYQLPVDEGIQEYKQKEQADWDKINENIKRSIFGNQPPTD